MDSAKALIVGVASAADGRLNARLGEPLDVTRRTARRDRCDAPMDVLSLVGARAAPAPTHRERCRQSTMSASSRPVVMTNINYV